MEKERRRGNDCDAEEGRPEIGDNDRMVTAFLTGSSSIIMVIMITTTIIFMISNKVPMMPTTLLTGADDQQFITPLVFLHVSRLDVDQHDQALGRGRRCAWPPIKGIKHSMRRLQK